VLLVLLFEVLALLNDGQGRRVPLMIQTESNKTTGRRRAIAFWCALTALPAIGAEFFPEQFFAAMAFGLALVAGTSVLVRELARELPWQNVIVIVLLAILFAIALGLDEVWFASTARAGNRAVSVQFFTTKVLLLLQMVFSARGTARWLAAHWPRWSGWAFYGVATLLALLLFSSGRMWLAEQAFSRSEIAAEIVAPFLIREIVALILLFPLFLVVTVPWFIDKKQMNRPPSPQPMISWIAFEIFFLVGVLL
jgi:hypothetical protein